MASLLFFILPFYLLTIFSQEASITAYTLSSSESLIDGQTLLSQEAQFELGFFSPSGSSNRYLGIWYKTIPVQTVVWVANRDSPLNDTSGVAKISSTGNIVIVNRTESNSSIENVIWSSNSPKSVENTIVEFLQSGNLVLKDVRSGDYLWQSFDYPGDTLLPYMKLGWDLKTGLNRYLSAWRSPGDPSVGGFTYGMDIGGYLETAIRNGSRQYYRGGPWNGVRHSGATDLKPNPIFTYEVVHNDDEIFYMYQLVNDSVIMRFVLIQTGTEAHLQRHTWVDRANEWVLLVSIPRDRCDDYALCGVYSTCDVRNVEVCNCLEGFRPKSPGDWRATDWSEGCEREVPVNCSRGEGFVKFTGVKLPATRGSGVIARINLVECRATCLNNCSCMAYSNLDIREGGSGCIMWFTDLIDIRQLSDAGQDLYIRMAASELDSKVKSRSTKTLSIVVATVAVFVGMAALCLAIWWIRKKRISKGGGKRDDLELPLYDLVTITNATNNFSEWNKLGEGGFGPVYKGKLDGDQEIAVKRLSKDSIQGGNEFMNEVILISKLQHRNLVRLLGCCIQGDEKLLVYEYMQNKSLDSFIFGNHSSRTDKFNEPSSSANNTGRLLDWQTRFDIILGIARGLLYLHHDSRLRIIHRDLKASNVLLDSEMIPKISDFGMARMCGGDQTHGETKRVVGTYGYMSPEYAMDGQFSVKSDVFSFGVLVLEIISGRKNRGFSHPDHDHNLLGHAWRLWNDRKSLELVDTSIKETCFAEDVLRCIHVGLLCVQKNTEARPNMSTVVLMLSSDTIVLPHPQRPGFYIERSTHNVGNSPQNDKGDSISRDITITMVQGR